MEDRKITFLKRFFTELYITRSYPLLNFDDPANLSMGKSSFLAYYNAEEFKVGEGGFKLSDYQGRLYELSKSPSGSQ